MTFAWRSRRIWVISSTLPKFRQWVVQMVTQAGQAVMQVLQPTQRLCST